MVHKCQVGIHAFELGVLLLQFAVLRQVWNCHAAELALPLVISGVADSVLPAGLTNLGAEFDFFQDADNLAFAEL